MDIVLIRHAAAVEADGISRDIGRVLTDAGRESMSALLPRLRAHLSPEQRLLIWSSPAARALGTAQRIANGLGIGTISCYHWIYSGNYQAFRQALLLADEGATLLVVGHEPHLSRWSEALSGEMLLFKKGGMAGFRLVDDVAPAAKRLWAFRAKLSPEAEERRASKTLTASTFKYALIRRLHKVLDRHQRFLRSPGDPRTTHKLRVATRQARSLMTFVKPLLGDAAFKDSQARLKAIPRQFAHLREIDVLMAQWLKHLADDSALPGSGLALALGQEREREQGRLEAYAKGPAIPEAIFTLLARADARDEESLEKKNPFSPFSRKRFEKWHKAATAALEKLDFQDHEDIHALRIRYKKLRYVKEAFPALEADTHHLAGLQEDLGIICDTFVNIRLLQEIASRYSVPGLAEDADAFTSHLLGLRKQMQEKHQA